MDKSRQVLPKKTAKTPPVIVTAQDKMFFQYNRYLQNEFLKILMTKRMEEKAKETAAEITNVCKTFHHVSKKLTRTAKHLHAVQNMAILQNQVDAQIMELNNFQKKYQKVSPGLEKMKCILDPLDKLKCKNVKLAESQGEMEKFESITSQVKDQLEKMHGKFEKYSGEVKNASSSLKDFQAKHQHVQQDLEMLEENVERVMKLSLQNAVDCLEQE